MTTVETQVHGYKQGHQLLSATITLSKSDQAIVDRLSDVAGPLRPGESFEPYLSAYPLPSGEFFVLSRTWQDLSVERAGCVRTLSLIIPIDQWAASPNLGKFFRTLARLDPPLIAETLSLVPPENEALPAVPNLRAGELLEALFLEDPQPVVIFEAPMREIIAQRLLTALWPKLRQRFSVVTFALSPRKIEGRFFDLMFAPIHARSRFAECRRLDARGSYETRHPWTSTIESRIFSEPNPRLLDHDQLRLIGAEDANSPSALRVALLWDDLLSKLDRTPTAALGLIDIAKSRLDGGPQTLLPFIPLLEGAIYRAVRELAPNEAWDFLDAISRKLIGTPLIPIQRAVSHATETLAAREPHGAIVLLERNARGPNDDELTTAIGRGFASNPSDTLDEALGRSTVEAFASVASSDTKLPAIVASRPALLKRLVAIIPHVDENTFIALRDRLLPFLIEDWQLDAVEPMLATLDSEELLREVRHLGKSNDFAAKSFMKLIVERARHLNLIDSLRTVLLAQAKSINRDRFIHETLSLADADIEWLVSHSSLDITRTQESLANLFITASHSDWTRIAKNLHLSTELIRLLPADQPHLIYQLLAQPRLPLPAFREGVFRLLETASFDERSELAERAIRRFLVDEFPGDSPATLARLLEGAGSRLSGSHLAYAGLSRRLPAPVLRRNLAAFNLTYGPARANLIGAIKEISGVLSEHSYLELDELSAASLASLLTEAEHENYSNFEQSCASILPVLMRSRRFPVSIIISLAFPPVYRELAKDIEVPDIYRFVPFVDWDRCKAARNELVDAFLSSENWNPIDLVITACRARDLKLILDKLISTYRGQKFLQRIVAVQDSLSSDYSDQLKRYLETTSKSSRKRNDDNL